MAELGEVVTYPPYDPPVPSGGNFGNPEADFPATQSPVPPAADSKPAPTIDSYLTTTPEQIEQFKQTDTALTRQQIGLEAANERTREQREEEYRSRQERMFDAEGATMADLKPWNADQEIARDSTNLWDKFGSPGFVLGMIASAFTAYPMTSALNAGAAAMNAINEGDTEAYNRHFDTWKSNTNLVLKRLDIEERAFNQLENLRSSNLADWRAKAEATLAQFNDQRKLALLNAGMDSEVIAALDTQVKLRKDLSTAQYDITQNDARMRIFREKLGDSKDPRKIAEAAQYADAVFSDAKTPEQIAVRNVVISDEYQNADSADRTKMIENAIKGLATARYGNRGVLADAQQRAADATNAWAESQDPVPDPTSPEWLEHYRTELSQNIKAQQPVQQQRADTADKAADKKNELDLAKLQEKIRSDVANEQIKRDAAAAKAQGGGLSGNKVDQIQKQIDAYDNNLGYIKELKETIKKYHGAVGLAGSIGRGGETLANLLSISNETDRKQILRDLELLKLGASRLLLDAEGRPLHASEERIDTIIGGTSYGDTLVNTLRSLDEVEKDYKNMRQQHNNRLPEKMRREPTVTIEQPSVNPPRNSFEDFPEVK